MKQQKTWPKNKGKQQITSNEKSIHFALTDSSAVIYLNKCVLWEEVLHVQCFHGSLYALWHENLISRNSSTLTDVAPTEPMNCLETLPQIWFWKVIGLGKPNKQRTMHINIYQLIKGRHRCHKFQLWQWSFTTKFAYNNNENFVGNGHW